MKKHSSNAIGVFARAPVMGKVKTRLAAEIGKPRALSLYRYFTEKTLASCRDSGNAVDIFFTPPNSRHLMTDWLGYEYSYQTQRGSDLGTRMKNAFYALFNKGYERAIIVGCDIPDITPAIIRNGFQGLGKNDCVLGPSQDGGYYLIGFSRNGFVPDIFDGIKWSGPSVAKETVKGLERKKLRFALLPILRDIDTIDDLNYFLDNPMTPSSRKREIVI